MQAMLLFARHKQKPGLFVVASGSRPSRKNLMWLFAALLLIIPVC